MDQNKDTIEFDETMINDEFAGIIRNGLDEAFEMENISVSEELISKTLKKINELKISAGSSETAVSEDKVSRIITIEKIESDKKSNASKKRIWRQLAGVVAALLVVGVGFITIRGGVFTASDSKSNEEYNSAPMTVAPMEEKNYSDNDYGDKNYSAGLDNSYMEVPAEDACESAEAPSVSDKYEAMDTTSGLEENDIWFGFAGSNSVGSVFNDAGDDVNCENDSVADDYFEGFAPDENGSEPEDNGNEMTESAVNDIPDAEYEKYLQVMELIDYTCVPMDKQSEVAWDEELGHYVFFIPAEKSEYGIDEEKAVIWLETNVAVLTINEDSESSIITSEIIYDLVDKETFDKEIKNICNQ